MNQNIQIPTSLFLDLYDYVSAQEDDRSLELCREMNKKIDKMIERELFTKYKRASTKEEREAYRQRYLQQKGVPSAFITENETPYDIPQG